MMATEGFTPATFFTTCDNAFYFMVHQGISGMDVDAFGKDSKFFHGWIQSNDDKFLLLNDDNQFQAEALNIQDQRESDCQFKMQFYKSSNGDGKAGRAVMLYVNKDGKKNVACCGEQHEVYAQEIDLPSRIEEDRHRAVFYRVKVESTSSKYMFESSLYPREFLGLEQDMTNPHMNKLVLRHIETDEMDTGVEWNCTLCR